MHKKGVEGALWMQVFYVVLALLIVILTYQYLSGRLGNQVFLARGSAALALDIDGGLSKPGGRLVIEEQLQKPASVQVAGGNVEVSAEGKSSSRALYADDRLQLDSGKAGKKIFVEIADVADGVRVRGE